ncbi:MAG: hypothetical protein ACHQAU_03100 [Gammaproteobacteria bacterium]
MKIVIFFVSMLLSVTGFAAQDAPVHVTGMYSDLYYNEEGGDLLGMEVFIFNSKDGYQALVQIAEGELPTVSLVPLDVDGANIRFTIPGGGAGNNSATFSGTVSAQGIKGHWSDGRLSTTGTKDEALKRGKSYWQ